MAFVLGNIEPDLNVFTYLHGMTHYEKLRGHSYDNVLPSMERLLKKIERRKYFGIRGYYLLGKVMHYTADILDSIVHRFHKICPITNYEKLNL